MRLFFWGFFLRRPREENTLQMGFYSPQNRSEYAGASSGIYNKAVQFLNTPRCSCFLIPGSEISIHFHKHRVSRGVMHINEKKKEKLPCAAA